MFQESRHLIILANCEIYYRYFKSRNFQSFKLKKRKNNIKQIIVRNYSRCPQSRKEKPL